MRISIGQLADDLKKHPVFLKNCKRNMSQGAKICDDCLFRDMILRALRKNGVSVPQKFVGKE